MTKVTKENCRINLKVKRGENWSWGTQDIDFSGKHMIGTVTRIIKKELSNTNSNWASVLWENGRIFSYRIGDYFYDLYISEEQLELEF